MHPVRGSYASVLAFMFIAKLIGEHPAGQVPGTTIAVAPSFISLCVISDYVDLFEL
jgi:hypothetical protein